jgi:hypothetical protein
MTYNLFISYASGPYNILGIHEMHLQIIISAWLKGENSFFLSGKQYYCKGFNTLQIFSNSKDLSKPKLEELQQDFGTGKGWGSYRYFSIDQLGELGENLTDHFIGNAPYGSQKDKKVPSVETLYVNQQRIEDLKSLTSLQYDLSKLIQICLELNTNWIAGNYFTVGLLLRTIINHVPPIFGEFTTFDSVLAQYGGISFKKSIKVLNESLRGIADGYNHQTIRKKESLPTPQQVDFRPNLDVLLSEIVCILRE